MRELKRNLWPHKVNINVDDTRMKIDDVETWLGQKMGAFRTRWNAVYHYNSTDYYFRNGQDATLFTLKWSS